MEKEIEKKIIEFTRNYYNYSMIDDYTIERYVGYQDEFPDSAVTQILAADNPEEAFFAIINEWDFDCDDWSYENKFFEELENEFSGFDSDDVRNVVFENFFWAYPESFLNPEIKVNIIINAGDGNYDFTLHNLLNYASSYGYTDRQSFKKSGLGWLAKQQGKQRELLRCVKLIDNCENYKTESAFVKSSIRELENACSIMEALSFLVKMRLQDAIELKMKLKEIEGKFNEYRPYETKGMPFGYIELDKSVNCGLVDYWEGSGSLIDIELDRDVKIPLHYIWDIIDSDSKKYAYSINQTYGLSGDCWTDSIKKLA